MTVYQLRCNLRHMSTQIVLVDAEGHEVFNKNLGMFVHWAKLPIYDGREIDYITPEDDNMLIIYLED